MDLENQAKIIIKALGGKTNITSHFHCMTRLRFNLKDHNKISHLHIKKLDCVVGLNQSGDQFQIIIGSKVAQVHSAIEAQLPEQQEVMHEDNKSKSALSNLFDIISGIFSPVIPAIAGAGILKGLLSFVISVGWVSNANQNIQILTAISDGVFYFIPMLLAFSAGKIFKANPYLSLALAAILFHPTLITLFKSGQPLSFLGLPLTSVSYASSVMPIILSIWLLGYVEQLVNRIMPGVLKTTFSPLLSLLIVAPIMLVIIGPIGIYIGNTLSVGILWLVDNAGPLAGIIVGGTLSLMVITGMHYVLVPVMINNITRLGYDPFKILIYLANFGQAGAAFGVFLRSKNKKTKTLAISTSFSALMGITEPAMYGINIPFKRPFAAALIGGACGGCIALTLGVKAYAYALSGIPGIPALVGPTFLYALLSLAVSFCVATGMTLVLGFSEESQPQNEPLTCSDAVQAGITDISLYREEELFSPVSGTVIPLHCLRDPVFADEVFGKGIAIVPSDGELLSPVNGRVCTVFATHHAITLLSESGAEILIHIGIDTVKLNGLYFTSLIGDDQPVNVGDPLIRFDLEALTALGIDPSVIMIITNTEHYGDINVSQSGKVESRQPFLKLTTATA